MAGTLKNFKLLTALFTSIVIVLVNQVSSQVKCPVDPTNPCRCSGQQGNVNVSLMCSYEYITQGYINSFFSNLRSVNNLMPDQILFVKQFSIFSTNINTLDLTPLVNSHFETLYIKKNAQLQIIRGPAIGRFQANTIFLEGSPLLTSDELAHFFNFVEPKDNVTALWLGQNKISQLPIDLFFPFTNLISLNLDLNQITKIEGGQFRFNGALEKIDLSRNLISQLGENAFLFEENAEEGVRVDIILDGNSISDEGISTNHGLNSRPNKEKFVHMRNNKLLFISEVKFRQSLKPQGSIGNLELSGNSFVCDDRMWWLRYGKDAYQPIVSGVYCENDPGKTVFDTDLYQGYTTTPASAGGLNKNSFLVSICIIGIIIIQI